VAAAALTWEMSRLEHILLPSRTALAQPPGPRWVLVLAGEITFETAAGSYLLAKGDAALVEASTAHRITASGPSEHSDVVVADLRAAVATHLLPSPLLVRGFDTRHAGVAALVATCPLGTHCSPSLFVASYGNLIGAAMTASWLDAQGRDPAARPDEAVAAVVSAVAARPGEPWTVERMARLVHLSRSALGERFRRTLGRGPTEVLREARMREARRLLGDPSRPVEHVALAVGYGSSAAFSRAFSSHHGIGPQAWRSPARYAEHGEDQPGRDGEGRAQQEGGSHAVGVEKCAS
jgi:AraC-like DNA-binding protein